MFDYLRTCTGCGRVLPVELVDCTTLGGTECIKVSVSCDRCQRSIFTAYLNKADSDALYNLLYKDKEIFRLIGFLLT